AGGAAAAVGSAGTSQPIVTLPAFTFAGTAGCTTSAPPSNRQNLASSGYSALHFEQRFMATIERTPFARSEGACGPKALRYDRARAWWSGDHPRARGGGLRPPGFRRPAPRRRRDER